MTHFTAALVPGLAISALYLATCMTETSVMLPDSFTFEVCTTS